MDTWGTHGFSTAAITGGLLGLSLGLRTVGTELQDPGPRPDYRQPPVAPRHAGTPGSRRHGAPSGPAAPPGAEEYRAAEQTMISPLLSDPSLDLTSGRHGAPAAAPVDPLGGPVPAHGSTYQPEYRSGYQPGYGRELDSDHPRGGHSRPVDGTHGSDGFLAGNLAALPTPARSTPDWSAPEWATPDALAPDSHQMGQPTSYPAERPVRSVELVGAGRPGHAAQPDEDASALGSLDSSELFGTLSRHYS